MERRSADGPRFGQKDAAVAIVGGEKSGRKSSDRGLVEALRITARG